MEPRFVPWFVLYSIQFVFYGVVALVASRNGPLRLAPVLATAVAARAILWFSDPVLEADYYRYLWDGHVAAHGINPYSHPPEHPALDAVETDYRFFITWSHIRTIYPPLAQYFFLFSHAVAPDSLLGLKVLLTCFDVATGLLLFRVDPTAGALYLLNPLVLKEVANSAHVDALPVFLTVVAVHWMSQGKKRLWAWLTVGGAAGAKLYAIALTPLFARVDPDWKRNAAAASLLFALLYLPFAGAGADLLSGTSTFGQLWLFNAGLFHLIDAFLPGQAIVAVLLAIVIAWTTHRLTEPSRLSEACLIVLGALLLLSPVVNAWYVLWVFPFAVLTRSIPWIAFTYLVGLAYAWFHSQDTAVYYRVFEYMAFGALLLWSHIDRAGRARLL